MSTDNGFKLLAIRPLKGCDPKFLKNLKEGMVYKFYQDYTYYIKDDEGNDVKLAHLNFDQFKSKPISKVDPPRQEVDLYSQNDLNINISAVVGKNGSGKSSLIELFYAVVFIECTRSGLLDLKQEIKKSNSEVSQINMEIDLLRRNLSYSIEDDDDKKRLASNFIRINELETNLSDLNDHLNSVQSAIDFAENNEIEVELFFEKIEDDNEKKIYRVSTSNKTQPNADGIVNLNLSKKNIRNLFYSISLNYSLYGLNSIYLGSWIERLFHKNDGYTTLVVINPMRTLGNINVYKENYLSQSRIMANLVDTKFNQKTLIDNKEIDTIRFKIPNWKLESDFEYYFTKTTDSKSLELIRSHKGYRTLFDYRHNNNILSFFLNIDDVELHLNGLDSEKIKRYLFQKLFKIARTYPEYRRFLKIENLNDQSIVKFEDFINELKKDRTHKTLKIRQLINTLKHGSLSKKDSHQLRIAYGIINNDGINWKDNIFDLSFNEYVKIICDGFEKELSEYENDSDKINKSKPQLIEFVPNAFFEPEVRYKGEDRFESLSSGEQQFINSINTVVYHILNLDSIPKHYSSVNIIFDEIELYFHVDFQRKFIRQLLKSIKNIDLSKIKSINILFSTHSPFILSDIPTQNVLRLENGLPSTKEQKGTFGANVHDLLHDSFFLSEGFMGKFAEEKLKETIKWLNDEKDFQNTDYHKEIIQLIGEPILQRKLSEMFDQKVNTNLELKIVQAQIDLLENRKKELENDPS